MSAKAVAQVWEMDLPHNWQSVLLALADHADHEGRNAHPGLPLLAWKSGYSTRQVRRILADLEEAGVIEPTSAKAGGRGVVTRYRIHFARVGRKAPLARRTKRQRVTDPPSQKADIPSRHDGEKRRTSCHEDVPGKADILSPKLQKADILTVPVEKADISDTKRRTSTRAGEVNQLLEPIPPEAALLPPSGVEGSTTAPPEPESIESIQGRMRDLAKRHPYTAMLSGPQRIAFLAVAELHIAGEYAAIWTDETGAPVPWDRRPDVLDKALTALIADPRSLLESKIRYIAIPRVMDPFAVTKARRGRSGGKAFDDQTYTPTTSFEGLKR